jgi:predicted XRE-type DNA-binding protein
MNERADTERIKAELAADIARIFAEQQLTDAQASERLTLTAGEVRRIRTGHVVDFMIDHLISILNRLNQHVTLSVVPAPVPKTDSRPIWEVIDAIVAGVPPEEWDKVPADLAENHDHYLYGTPKRS